jgi:hypothetical protein
MEFLLGCECGNPIHVTEGMCGTTVRCACGHELTVPSFGELRRSAAPSVRLEENPQKRSPVEIALLAAAAVLFFGLMAVYGATVFAAGGAAPFLYFVSLVGHVWLLIQIARDCAPDAFALALLVPVVTWIYGFKRFEVAWLPLLLSVGGWVGTLIATFPRF